MTTTSLEDFLKILKLRGGGELINSHQIFKKIDICSV